MLTLVEFWLSELVSSATSIHREERLWSPKFLRAASGAKENRCHGFRFPLFAGGQEVKSISFNTETKAASHRKRMMVWLVTGVTLQREAEQDRESFHG